MPRIEPVPMEELEPEVRESLEKSVASGAIASTIVQQIMAYNRGMLRLQVGMPGPVEMGVLLEPRLLELVRLRSAQIGGCAECAAARYGGLVNEEEVSCLIIGQDGDLTERERLAVKFITLVHTDHHSIGDELYLELKSVFSTAEIVELSLYVASNVGLHRVLHTWDLHGTEPPAIAFDPADVVDAVPAFFGG